MKDRLEILKVRDGAMRIPGFGRCFRRLRAAQMPFELSLRSCTSWKIPSRFVALLGPNEAEISIIPADEFIWNKVEAHKNSS